MVKLSKETISLLEYIESRLDPAVEDDFSAQWDAFLFDRFDGEIFTPNRKKVKLIDIKLPDIHINDAIQNIDLMLQAQLSDVIRALSSHTKNLCIRSNYGTGILSSLFGAEIYIMPREMKTLPTTRAFNDTEKIRSLADKGIPSLTNGLGKNVFEFGELCAEAFESYPLVKKYVEVYHPDTQGPLDIAELLWGGEMFISMYEEPELVHDLLELIQNTYIAFLEKWFKMFPSEGEVHCHWPFMRHRGHILLRNDSAMNLTPQFYQEFSVPYDTTLLSHFNGGAMHFCGRGDHYIESLCSIPNLTGINMSQPELNDMETIYRSTIDKGIKLLGFSKEYAEKAITRPGGLHHNIHC